MLNTSFIKLILTIAFNHTVAVIAHITEELDSGETGRVGVYTAKRKLGHVRAVSHFSHIANNIMMSVRSSKAIIALFLPGYNESRSKPTPSAHNGDGRGKAFHTWRTQNAVNKNKRC